MKVRWREHEIIFATILVVTNIIMTLLKLYDPPYGQQAVDFASKFRENGFPFAYGRNVLFPQIASILLVYISYLSINLFIIPSIKKISFTDFEKLLTVKIARPVLFIAVTSYFLAIGINILTYYGRPYLFNYGDYQLLAMLGYNDKPLTDLFSGFDRATWMVILFTAFAGLRELITWLISKPDPKREFRVLVLNTVTPLVFLCLLFFLFTNPIRDTFMDYLAWVTPALVLYIYHTFWLFPLREKHQWLSRPVLSRLLLSTFGGAVFSALVFSGNHKLFEFSLYWAFLLFIVTPFSWLLYQQRKDKILQLKGMETALARSATDLQFLRSQINPHFLFNALNTLYGTALKEKSGQTAEGIQILGDMMRFMLHDNHLDFIPMNKEIEYLKNYIALQKLRIASSPGIVIEDNISEENCQRHVAPMLLIPFVENAFKHGISLKEQSWIRIRLVCTETFISFEVRNSTHNRSEADTEKDKSGIGLKNVAERLKLLYPGKHELNISENEGEFTVRMIIQ
jgi:two-component system LytT family sensor kinase